MMFGNILVYFNDLGMCVLIFLTFKELCKYPSNQRTSGGFDFLLNIEVNHLRKKCIHYPLLGSRSAACALQDYRGKELHVMSS